MHSLDKSARLHSVSNSAIPMREAKKVETLHRIRACALGLTDAHGLDGWTMDDLADAAQVSRRTLFNYVPGKIDAIIGSGPEFRDEDLVLFRAGGPTGSLVADLAALSQAMLADKEFERDTIAARRRIFTTNPRLAVIAHERFEEVSQTLVDHILAREGAGFGADRARLLVRLLVAIFDSALLQMLADDDPAPLDELFDAAVVTARELLA
ncbi:MAG: TetR family transcriptional regulator [Actinobacteria bacterium]|uniref:Unannotated protein n=1 Tax=freshwater metagenome TaxID=449393 RepID=A0A6J6RXZ9_9ZZZZ|nr:TetR family transcriptional regulator [Actinomycetota bacterium]